MKLKELRYLMTKPAVQIPGAPSLHKDSLSAAIGNYPHRFPLPRPKFADPSLAVNIIFISGRIIRILAQNIKAPGFSVAAK
jgi:hypothetical protein